MSDEANLFNGTSSVATVERLALPDAAIEYLPHFLSGPDRGRLLNEIEETTTWSQERLKMFGRVHPLPRLTAWYGDTGVSYTYSGITVDAMPWTEPLLEIKELVEKEAHTSFNSVLLNLYRHGSDGVAWHSDDEPELGPEPVIASVSLGELRKFQLRHREHPELRHEMLLENGSLLIMRGSTQSRWEHQVPKTSKPVGPRINLTFRRLG